MLVLGRILSMFDQLFNILLQHTTRLLGGKTNKIKRKYKYSPKAEHEYVPLSLIIYNFSGNISAYFEAQRTFI